MNIIEKINAQYPELSKTQRKIADFLMINSEKACFLSLKDISKEVGIAEVTMINFGKKLGFNSFVELKKELQEHIRTKLSHTQKLTSVLSTIEGIDSNIADIVSSEVQCVEETIKKVNVADIKKATKMIKESKKIYVIGTGISEAVANFLLLRLQYLGLNVERFRVTSFNLQSLRILKMEKDSVFIVISLPKHNGRTSRLVKYLRKKDFKIIGITDSLKSPIANYSNVVFECLSNSFLFFNSITGLISISNILLSALAIDSKQEIMDSLEQWEEIRETIF